MAYRRSWAALAGLALAGCAGAARLPVADVRLPAAYEAASATTAALPAQALDRWWTLYDDPQLTSLIEEALVASPTARTALSRIDQARAQRAQTLSAYLPQGNLVGSAQTQHTDQNFGASVIAGGASTGGTTTDPTTGQPTTSTGGTTSTGSFLTPSGDLQTYAAQFNISYELDLFGRRLAARRGANADVAAQRFDYEASRATLARDVAIDLFRRAGPPSSWPTRERPSA